MRRAATLAALAFLLAACGALNPPSSPRPSAPQRSEPALPSAPPRSPTASSTAPAPKPAPVVQRRGGAYYQDDGPGDNAPPNLEQTPDAVPRDEPVLRSATNRTYVVFGKSYHPHTDNRPFVQRGIGSWYGRKFHGQKTSSGEPYDMYAMTAAHPTLPIPSYVRVTNPANGRSVVVRVNDRGPFHSERIIDLSYTAALKLDYVNQGSALVDVVRVNPGDRPPVVAQGPAPAHVPSAPAPTASGPAASAPAPVRAAAAPPATAPAAAAAAASGASPATPAPKPAPTNASGAGAAEKTVQSDAQATTPLATSTQPDGTYLQIGAFGARDNAESFRARVQRDLAWLTESIYVVPGPTVNRVQIGPYKSRDEAGKIAEKIRDTLQLKPVFVLK